MIARRRTRIPRLLRAPTGLVLVAFLLIAGFFLLTEHTAHTLGVLPFALLALCPLLHLFMHGGHGGGHGGHNSNEHRSDHGGTR